LPAADCRVGKKVSTPATSEPLFYPVMQYAPIPERSFRFLSQRPSAKVANAQSQPPDVPYCGRSLVGLRLLESPQRIDVTNDRDTLRMFGWRGRRQRVVSQRGPWQVSGNWWEGAFARRYYEVETGGGETYLCYCEQESQGWFVQGVFD
jgi:hypothetical protein